MKPVKRIFHADPLTKKLLVPDMPVEGELLPSSNPGEKQLYNVDDIRHSRRRAQALAVLFDNERARGEGSKSPIG